MRVMVTGATGFFGGHVCAALVRAGHVPQLLVREPARAEAMCEVHGIDPGAVIVFVGDVRDQDTVREAVRNCDACVHLAAAATSFEVEDAAAAFEVNVAGARTVLDLAVDEGCDPVVHVSTLAVIFPPAGPVFSADDPLHLGGVPYTASKAEADRHARSLQQRGAPVVIVYPSGLTGPCDLGGNAVSNILSQTVMSDTLTDLETGGYLIADVRDAAAALVALLQPGRGARRYMMGGHFLTWAEFASVLDRVTGFARSLVPVTRAEVAASIAEPEAAEIALGVVPSDDRPLLADTGVAWRTTAETLADTIQWLIAEGRLDSRWAPGLSQSTLPPTTP